MRAPNQLIITHTPPRLVRLIHKAVNIPAGGIQPRVSAPTSRPDLLLPDRCFLGRRASAQ